MVHCVYKFYEIFMECSMKLKLPVKVSPSEKFMKICISTDEDGGVPKIGGNETKMRCGRRYSPKLIHRRRAI